MFFEVFVFGMCIGCFSDFVGFIVLFRYLFFVFMFVGVGCILGMIVIVNGGFVYF